MTHSGCSGSRSAGYSAVVFNNGSNAIEHFRKTWKNINAVILDLVLPDQSGREVFSALKEINPP
ncbi:MAG: response regulator [Chitinispirillaceae bacterium]|nr:response regulator [Chitinispirillaceae bacterium]